MKMSFRAFDLYAQQETVKPVKVQSPSGTLVVYLPLPRTSCVT